MRPAKKTRLAALALFTAASLALPHIASAYDVSPAPILQDFESSWQNITTRMPDIFAAGYGSVYTPPPGRADSGNQSVGYDVYDRYDMGSAGNPTLYGTQTGLTTMVNAIHTMGGNSYIDLVWNQSGFRNRESSGFAAQGGYPGFAVTLQNTDPTAPGYNQYYNDINGDYHDPSSTGDQWEALAGLDDIAQYVNVPGDSNTPQGNDYEFIRQPTTAGNPRNIPAGTVANIPDPNNARFYPDQSLTPLTLNDPTLGLSNVKIYPFNNTAPLNGTPTVENSTDYLMRYAQYMIQVIGADGFRVDAAKNMPSELMDYLDLAVFDESNRTLLNGQKQSVFSFQEVYDSSQSVIQPYVNKSGTSTNSTTVGGNRDVYDFPLFEAMQSNLTSTGSNNSWFNIVGKSADTFDDGLMNGSEGVKFVSSQDDGPPALDNVAYAYTLMLPGNAMVYDNSHNFGTETDRNFPKDGRGDALGGTYGNTITTLVDLRNRYGRGDYQQDYLEQNNYAFERKGSALVMLSNATTAGFDSRSFNVSFAAGTPLVEMTGNAGGSYSDPNGDIPKLLVVQQGSNNTQYVNARFLHNSTYAKGGASTYTTGAGYLIYGLPTPTGTLTVTNSKVITGAVPNQSDSNIAYENGTDVVSNIDVVTSATFSVTLNTTMNNIPSFGHWHDADGDNAQIKIDGGIDVSGTGLTTDPNSVSYGFENFSNAAPGYAANNKAGGDGQYSQTINTSQLGQGYHYITVIAFSHNDDTSSPPVYTDWRQTIYVDTAPANSAVLSFNDAVANVNENRQLLVKSVDGLSNNIQTLLDAPFGLTDAQVLALLGSNSQPTQTDVNLWQMYYSGVTSGNHTATIVSYKPDGSYTIQRFNSQQIPSLATNTVYGAGLGDLNHDGKINSSDVSAFTPIVQSNNTQFNAAADINGDGIVDLADTFLLGPILLANKSDFTAYNNFIHGSYVTTGTFTASGANPILQDTAATTTLSANASVTATYIRGKTLNLAAGSSFAVNSNTNKVASVSVLSNLNFSGSTDAWAGKLDLGNSNLIVSAAGATGLANITNQLKSGFAQGNWNGAGIVSSSAAADSSHLTTLGVILNDNGAGSPIYSTFNSQNTHVDDVLVKYTYFGDANLDGVVNGADYQQLDAGFGAASTGWQNGDFNYDGVIDGSDFSLIDNAFNQTLASSAAPLDQLGMPQTTLTPTSVPEPATTALLLIVAPLLTRRRRR